MLTLTVLQIYSDFVQKIKAQFSISTLREVHYSTVPQSVSTMKSAAGPVQLSVKRVSNVGRDMLTGPVWGT